MLNSTKHGIIFFDIETTGLDTQNDKIVEIAAVSQSGNTFSTLVNPEATIPSYATQIHGITNTHVIGAPAIKEAIQQLIAFFDMETPDNGNTYVIAHNGHFFDVPMLSIAAHKVDIVLPESWKFIDSIMWADICLPKHTKKNLQSIRALLDIPANQAHRALDDSKVLAQVFNLLTDNLDIEQVFDIVATHKNLLKMSFGEHKNTPLSQISIKYLCDLMADGLLKQPAFANIKDHLESLHHEKPDTQLHFV